MTWLDVEWTSGDTVPETKLDTMQANLDHLRDEVRYRTVVWDGKASAITGIPPAGGNPQAGSKMRFRVNPYGATSAGDAMIATGAFDDATSWIIDSTTAIDISGLPDGQLEYVELLAEWDETGGGSWATFKRMGGFWFLKTADATRLSIEVSWVGFYDANFSNWSGIFTPTLSPGWITIALSHLWARTYRA